MVAFLGTIPAGIGCELPFLPTRYRNFRLPLILSGGAIASLILYVISYVPYGYIDLSPAYPISRERQEA